MARIATPPFSFQGNVPPIPRSPAMPNAQIAREPVTPVSGLRHRTGGPQSPENPTTPGGGPGVSPTSETSTISNASARIFDPARSLYRPLASGPPSAVGTPGRKVIIRSDPAIVTCFDPTDKELYDLWAPKS